MTRRGLAFVGIAACSALILFQRWILGEEYEAPWYVWIPVLAILGWSIWQLRERPDPNSKAMDFNPRRGVLYFFLGFLIFPVMVGMDAVFGADVSMTEAALVTGGGSVFIGLAGMFTEHVGV